MKIDGNRYSQRLRSSIFIDLRYQSINCFWLISITIDLIDYRISSIGQAGLSVFCGLGVDYMSRAGTEMTVQLWNVSHEASRPPPSLLSRGGMLYIGGLYGEASPVTKIIRMK